MTPKRIGLIEFERVTALHLIAPAEAFCAATLDDGYGRRISCYEVCTVGVHAQRFRTESGLEFQAQTTLADAPDFDTILVAGGPGIRELEISEAVSSLFLLKRVSETRRIGTVCTGLYGLATTGLLDDRDVTVHWRFASDAARRFPRLRINHKRALVQDGPFYTSSGLGAGINLSLAMIREDYGPHVAQSVERDLVLSPSENEPKERASFDSRPNERFADLVPWIVRNLQQDLSVEILARRACHVSESFQQSVQKRLGGTAKTLHRKSAAPRGAPPAFETAKDNFRRRRLRGFYRPGGISTSVSAKVWRPPE